MPLVSNTNVTSNFNRNTCHKNSGQRLAADVNKKSFFGAVNQQNATDNTTASGGFNLTDVINDIADIATNLGILDSSANAQINAVMGLLSSQPKDPQNRTNTADIVQSIINRYGIDGGGSPDAIKTALLSFFGRQSTPKVEKEFALNSILSKFGINNNTLAWLTGQSPSVAKGALQAAGLIYDLLVGGESDPEKYKTAAQQLKDIEHTAKTLYYPGTNNSNSVSANRWCEPAPYATDLITRHPKYKFLFAVEFIFNEYYKDLKDYDYSFVIKSATRPSIEYEYEDVNMYNFRTKVIKRSQWSPMTLRFHDDDLNHMMKFYNNYLKSTVPIANKHTEADAFGNEGMGWNGKSPHHSDLATPDFTASVGSLEDKKTKTVIKEIKLYHIFDFGHKMNVFKFINPKITQIQLDELDMSDGSSGNEITIEFNYDTMFLFTDLSLETSAASAAAGESMDVKGLTNNGSYPLAYNGPTPNASSGNDKFNVHQAYDDFVKNVMEAEQIPDSVDLNDVNSFWRDPDTGQIFSVQSSDPPYARVDQNDGSVVYQFNKPNSTPWVNPDTVTTPYNPFANAKIMDATKAVPKPHNNVSPGYPNKSSENLTLSPAGITEGPF